MAKIGERRKKLGDLVKYEEGTHVGYCRDAVVVADATADDYEIGTLLGFDGTDWRIADPAAADGSEVIAGVIIEDTPHLASPHGEVVILYRGPAGVGDDMLVLGDYTLEEATAALEELGIKVMVQI